MEVQLCEACETWNPFWSEVDESTSSDFALALELAEQDVRHLAHIHARANQQSGNVRVSNFAFSSPVPVIPTHVQGDDVDFLDVSSDLSHDHRKEILEMHQRERGSHITKHDTLVCNQHNAFLVSRFEGAGNCEDMMIPDNVYNPLKEHFHGVLKDQRKGKRRSFGSPMKGKHLPAAAGSQNTPSAGAASGEPSLPSQSPLAPLTPAQLLAEASLVQTAASIPDPSATEAAPTKGAEIDIEKTEAEALKTVGPVVCKTSSPAKQPKAAQKPRASPKRSPVQPQPQPRQQTHESSAALTHQSQQSQHTGSGPDFAELGCSNWQEVVDMMQRLRHENRTLKNQVELLQTFAKSQVRRVDQLQEQLLTRTD